MFLSGFLKWQSGGLNQKITVARIDFISNVKSRWKMD